MPQGGAARALQRQNAAEDYGKDGVARWTEGGSRSPTPAALTGPRSAAYPQGCSSVYTDEDLPVGQATELPIHVDGPLLGQTQPSPPMRSLCRTAVARLG